ncbi:MAG: hypothetical protein ACRCS5_05980 [Sphingomonas sp.]|uniref:hypothetical protein n=1 Tax=Sphingomonas sp. TaxID=28214 RepID=UPI003BF25C33
MPPLDPSFRDGGRSASNGPTAFSSRGGSVEEDFTGATMKTVDPIAIEETFDPMLWLAALSSVGGGYALTADRRLCLMVANCDPDDLAPLTAQLIGNPARREAVRVAIEQRQAGDR